MGTPSPSPAIRAAIRTQARHQRNGSLGVFGVIGLGLVLLVFGHLLGPLAALLNDVEQDPFLRVIGVLLLVLIPTAGIYSLVGQFAFWEGWIGGLQEPAQLFAAEKEWARSRVGPEPHYVVYLDGIHQHANEHPPRITAFLSLLEQALGPHTRLLKGIEAYTVLPVGLAEDPGTAWFWRRLFTLQEQNPSALVQVLAGMLVQANNVIKVGISSDRRYGPIVNVEQALKVAERLAEQGFHPSSGSAITLLGYSGGGEMAMGMADYLRRICRCPVHIITFCGVFSGNQPLTKVAGITTVVGTRDPLQVLGRIAFPGRSPLLPFTPWNKAVRAGAVRRTLIAGMTHNGNQGPFSERHREAVIQAILAAMPPQP
ncbi:MAG: alpha/beta hydrolase [Cyanobacteriota bacterium]|nr:alpha/beta hydrolase [Cyanobacteriota bacterium]